MAAACHPAYLQAWVLRLVQGLLLGGHLLLGHAGSLLHTMQAGRQAGSCKFQGAHNNTLTQKSQSLCILQCASSIKAHT